MSTTPTLFDRFKANVAKAGQLNAQASQLQQQLAAVQQAGAELNGATNLLLELDPTLPDQLQKAHDAAKKKAPDAPTKS